MEPITLGAIAFFVIISPFINAGINRVNWSPKVKSLVAWGVAIAIALTYVLFTGGIANIYQLFLAAPAIYGYGQAIYIFLVKNIATKFEAITTPGSIVVSPSQTEGKVDITTDATISSNSGSPIQASPPVSVTTSTEQASPEPVQIIKEDNVVG
jgi:hypothetical protein